MWFGGARPGEGALKRTPPSGVSGTSFLEALVALALISLLVPAIWATLARQRSAGTRMVAKAEALEGIRVVSWVLPRELELGSERRDWMASEDTLALRAFRGFAVADSVGTTPRDHWVCFAGVRAPDPRKDSVLALLPSGLWIGAELVHRRKTDAPCSGTGPDGGVEFWSVSEASGPALAFRLFERGSYHLTGGALRYRRGEGGRQPLTSEFLETGNFLPGQDSLGDLQWRLGLRPNPLSHRPSEEPRPSSEWRGRGG
jgi:hypothetical protein